MTVYIIRAGKDGPVKIGHAANPGRRLRELQGGHYERLRIIATKPGAREEERELHRQFKDSRLIGEWFRFADAMLVGFMVIPEPAPNPPKPRSTSKVRNTYKPAEIEAKARAVGLSMTEVCRRAQLHRSLFTKWKSGQKGLLLSTHNRMVAVVRTAEIESGMTAD